MAGIGIALVFTSYSILLYGYCLFQGYNVTPKQLFSFKEWPPGTPIAPPKSGTSVPGPTGK